MLHALLAGQKLTNKSSAKPRTATYCEAHARISFCARPEDKFETGVFLTAKGCLFESKRCAFEVAEKPVHFLTQRSRPRGVQIALHCWYRLCLARCATGRVQRTSLLVRDFLLRGEPTRGRNLPRLAAVVDRRRLHRSVELGEVLSGPAFQRQPHPANRADAPTRWYVTSSTIDLNWSRPCFTYSNWSSLSSILIGRAFILSILIGRAFHRF